MLFSLKSDTAPQDQRVSAPWTFLRARAMRMRARYLVALPHSLSRLRAITHPELHDVRYGAPIVERYSE